MSKNKKGELVRKVKKSGSAKSLKRLTKDAVAEPKHTAAQGSRGRSTGDEPVSMERRASTDRRKGEERRKVSAPVAQERRQLERREKVSRRRQIDPTTCERSYSIEEIEFMSALDAYKRTSGRMFPTCSEILEVLRDLGYEKRPVVAPAEPSLMPATTPVPAPADVALIPMATL